MIKRVLLTPSFWLLLATNLYLVYYYDKDPAAFKTVVAIYWMQSVLIGIFTFIELFSSTLNRNKNEMASEANAVAGLFRPGLLAFFFLVHYMGFHLAYLLFFSTTLHEGEIDKQLLLAGSAAFALTLLIAFVQKRGHAPRSMIGMGNVFFKPYLRIIPMHLMIIGPALLGWKASSVFLILKTIADLTMYVLIEIQRVAKKPEFSTGE